jgi:hypothetical protein
LSGRGNTLVVETGNLKEEALLDAAGLPGSGELRRLFLECQSLFRTLQIFFALVLKHLHVGPP